MRKKPARNPALFFLSCVALAACAQTTSTRGTSYIDPDFHGPQFASLIVEAKVQSLAERQAIERTAVAELGRAGLMARAAIDIVPPTRTIGGPATRRAYMNTGADGVVEITPERKFIDRDYIPGTYEPYRVRSLGPRRGYIYEPGIYEPGFVTEEPHARYNVEVATLPGYRAVWRGEFETAGPTGMDFDEVGAHFAGKLVEKMAQDGIIRVVSPQVHSDNFYPAPAVAPIAALSTF